MKKRNTIVWLAVASLMAWVTGCSKTENTTPPSREAEKQPKTEEVKPVAAAQPQTQPPVNVTAANAATDPPVETVAKVAKTALAEAPKPVNTSNRVPSIAPGTADETKVAPAILSQDQMVRGLQEALGKGLQQAINQLGHDGGFLTNLDVKIPMPEKLQKIENVLRTLKQDKLADDFITTMNRAAEQAVPEASAVFAAP